MTNPDFYSNTSYRRYNHTFRMRRDGERCVSERWCSGDLIVPIDCDFESLGKEIDGPCIGIDLIPENPKLVKGQRYNLLIGDPFKIEGAFYRRMFTSGKALCRDPFFEWEKDGVVFWTLAQSTLVRES